LPWWVYLGWKKKTQTKDALQKNIKWISVVFGILALLLALNFPHIVDLMVIGISMIVIYVPITLLALLNKNVYHYRSVALWSVILAFAVNTSFFIYGILLPEQFNAKSSFIPAFLVATISTLVGMFFVKRKRLDLSEAQEK